VDDEIYLCLGVEGCGFCDGGLDGLGAVVDGGCGFDFFYASAVAVVFGWEGIDGVEACEERDEECDTHAE